MKDEMEMEYIVFTRKEVEVLGQRLMNVPLLWFVPFTSRIGD